MEWIEGLSEGTKAILFIVIVMPVTFMVFAFLYYIGEDDF
jgi:hypothetical protein